MSNHGSSKYTGSGMPPMVEQALADTIHTYNTGFNTRRGALPSPNFTADTHTYLSTGERAGRRWKKSPSAILVDGPVMIAKIINTVTVACEDYLDAHSGSELQLATRFHGHVKWVDDWGTLDTEARWKRIKSKASNSKLVSGGTAQ